MNKYKICVYAICKNESKFVKRWVESMKEADEIYVLDTGSEDNTRDLLESLGVHVYKKTISPWRFDTARNESLKLVPSDCDICVCTDLDEVFESGWRAKLENIWEENITRLAYNYNWKLDKRFSIYANKSRKGEPEYKKQEALYALHVRMWNKEHINNPELQITMEDDLPEPYTNQEIN